jgi:lauroyl/myristoyl acyltransferase
MKTAMIRALRLVAGRLPHAGFALARGLAWLTQPLGRGIPEREIHALVPELDPARLRAARRRTWSNFLMAEALDAALERPGSRSPHPRVVPTPAADLRPPAIIASFHIGPFPAIAAVLEQLDGEVLAVHRGRFAPRPGVTLVRIGESEWERARIFHRAVQALRSGGFVYTALDGYGDDGYDAATLEVPMLGGTVSLARGGFALARITGAPLVPMVARWRGTRVEITSGDPIEPGRTEVATAAATASWIEGYLREYPGEIHPRTVEIVTPPERR